MNEHFKIYFELKSERDTLVTILARNGYTVRIGKDKPEKGSASKSYVEYWK